MESKDRKREIDLDKVFMECTDYVMCATLNQVVNYIPMVMMCEKRGKNGKTFEIYSISYELIKNNEIKFDQKAWEKNLTDVLDKKNNNVPINGDAVISVKIPVDIIDKQVRKIKDSIIKKNIKGRKILWNLTGGQRNLAFIILNLILEDEDNTHYVIYLEGNSGRIVVGEKENNRMVYRQDTKIYGKNFTLDEAVGLAGFEIKETEKKINNILDQEFFQCEEEELFEDILKKYMDNDEMVNTLLENNSLTKEERLEKLFKGLALNRKNREMLKNRLLGGNIKYPVGYLLEYMAVWQIKSVILKNKWKKFFVGLYHSVKPYNQGNESDNYGGNKQFCEFDILLLTKTGQVIIFECKSGGMTGENAKARGYATYAVAGVYGTPILITPFLKNQLEDIGGTRKKIDKNKENENKGYAAFDAVKSAKRNQLRVWGMDEIEEKLIALLYDMGLDGENLGEE